MPQLTAASMRYTLARNSFEASFVPAAQKAAWIQALDVAFAAAPAAG